MDSDKRSWRLTKVYMRRTNHLLHVVVRFSRAALAQADGRFPFTENSFLSFILVLFPSLASRLLVGMKQSRDFRRSDDMVGGILASAPSEWGRTLSRNASKIHRHSSVMFQVNNFYQTNHTKKRCIRTRDEGDGTIYRRNIARSARSARW